ncbi:hypothetical protein S1OALGB6SA_765 [Olavius algarvensis spirochete endosymbiont]|nr:hypothetical protein S1OALGB6SA_765 [Olavius algarvensis spirochete endosymbiont]
MGMMRPIAIRYSHRSFFDQSRVWLSPGRLVGTTVIIWAEAESKHARGI